MIRQVIVARRSDFLSALPGGGTARTRSQAGEEGLFLLVDAVLRKLLGDYTGPLNVLGIPLLDFEVKLTDAPPQELPALEELVISVGIPDSAGAPDWEGLNEFRSAVENANNNAFNDGKPEPFLGVGADLFLDESEYFCPANVDQVLFGDRTAARLLTRSAGLVNRGLTGNGVNIVVIDQGFDATKVQNFGGGFVNGTILPGATTRGHGLMLVRNIADAAPNATFFDVPIIPTPRISNVTGFISSALHVFYLLKLVIAFLRQFPPWDGPWVLVNAWSIFDRSTEAPPGDYTEGPGHPFNLVVGAMVDDLIDIVFAAGNCGQFCPDRRCGKRDIGPGSSIFGANSHPRVLTTGAVRTDTRWLGNSSQGHGQQLLSRWKPDLCAPSSFREDHDAFLGNTDGPFVGDTGSPYVASTGTSAACGLAAGIVGAIRSGWDQTILPPDDLKQALNDNARKTEGPPWNERLGHGIIDAEATVSALEAN